MSPNQHRLFLAIGMLSLGFPLSPVSADEPAPALIDLRPRLAAWELPARSQGGRPTCSVFTFTGALEFAVARSRNRGERLSVDFLNWSANQTRGGTRDGGYFSDMWNGFAAHGICAEEKMPYQPEFDPARSPAPDVLADAKKKLELGLQLHWIKKWNVETGLTEDEFAGVRKTLDRGWPVCGGFRWPKKARWKKDVLQMCAAKDVFDGHSVLLVGYHDDAGQPGGGVFIFRNTNGDARDGQMPYSYARAYMNDAVWVESNVKP